MNEPTKVDLIKMVRSILRIPKHKQIICPECDGSGEDTAHKGPDGSYASCEQCEGQGSIIE